MRTSIPMAAALAVTWLTGCSIQPLGSLTASGTPTVATAMVGDAGDSELNQPNLVFAQFEGLELDTQTASGKDTRMLDHPAARMIAQLGRETMDIMTGAERSAEDRSAYFRTMLAGNLDIRGIGRFVLGKHWRRTSKPDRVTYMTVFSEFIVTVFARQLGSAQIDAFTVIAARNGPRKDILVKSLIMRQGKPYSIIWRMRPKGERYLVVDLAVEGISMAMTRRQEFNSIIRANGGKIDGLTQKLRSFTTTS
jgi:phospholipid transport system substrate-binding protein